MSKSIRVYEYVNHPYEAVKLALQTEASEIFQNATKVAASRAQTVASELHVNIAGIEVGTDISISVNAIEEVEKKVMAPQKTILEIEWEAAKAPRFFPLMKAELEVYPLTSTETQLDLSGNYEPPFGWIGTAVDALVGHRIAEASVHQFIKDVATYLRTQL
ncbi:MAG: hypothetical protein HKN25_03855 [Pyrinomonadaceae bacterium]|nr:hypothetical protein [Pyrinomonadaceae bacterium]